MSLAAKKECASLEQVFSYQERKLQELVPRLYANSPFYRRKLDQAGIDPRSVKTWTDLSRLPFTTKEELRIGYPLGLMAVPEEQIVRIHSSSGTTGKPIVVPYTAGDVATWAEMMARCMAMTGVTNRDRVQVTPGYGLWTAGIGFQAGVERLGAMAIPTGPGNTEKQMEMMCDLKTTVLCSTSSYALLIAEEIHKRGLLNQIKLRLGIIGSERWGEKMRARIEELLGIETFDIYGLTEIYGPGTSIDCPLHYGLHYWYEHLLFEIIDPVSGRQLPPGQEGELVVTTLTKEGMPLLRYRTRDITSIIPEMCPCGSPYPMHERILGRTDDMIKIKGVNIYPGQIEHVLKITRGAGSEYQIIVTRKQGKDSILVKVECLEGAPIEHVAGQLRKNIKTRIGILTETEAVPPGTLPRSEKKSKRVFDYRNL
ncbi:MAG: phenylacetate--CoA ligase [Peptococcaceae bacterium]|nr:phenylacetate--CoA ligase [Peptococcaceae bacterium]